MYVQTNTDVVLKVKAHGYVTRGPRATMLEPDEGLMVDVEAVYEVDENGKTINENIGSSLTAGQFEQVEDALIDAYVAANG